MLNLQMEGHSLDAGAQQMISSNEHHRIVFSLCIFKWSSINSWTMEVRSRNSEKKNDQTAKNAGCVINNISQVALRSSSSKRSTLHRMNKRRTKLYSSAELFSHPTARRSRQKKKGQYKIDCSAWLHGSYSAHRHCHERCENVEKLAIGTSITSVQ